MTTQPPKTPAQNRRDVSAHTRRCRTALALLRQLAEAEGYGGRYLAGLDVMLSDLETGAKQLTLKN